MKTTIIVIFIFAAVSFFVFKPKGSNESQILLDWTGLSSYPTWQNNDLSVVASGNQFSRQFTGTFKGSTDQIKSWVESQTVLREANVQHLEEKQQYIYQLEPKQGAQGAEVRIDYGKGVVTIEAYWS